jgi:ammonia channel protein AmtB
MMIGIPVAVLGCGFLFPDALGYVGIGGTTSGLGLVFVNVFVAFVGGIVGGAVLSYRTRNPIWVLLGPIAAYVAGGTLFDIAVPWKVLLVSLFAPLASYATYRLLRRARIDDPKIGPLTLGAGVYGAIVSGFVGWHVKTGGYPGITSGKYAFQHAEITPGWQLVGVLAAIALAVIPALILCLIFERAGGLRVSEKAELEGLDHSYWDLPPVLEPGFGLDAEGRPARAEISSPALEPTR